MGESEKGIESPIEVLWQLVEESGKWTEEIASFARYQIIVFLFVILQSVMLISYVFYNVSKDPEPIPFPYLIVIAVALVIHALIVGNALIQLRRKYRNRLARRDRWREKFEMLKKKEEEIEKLLSEEAGRWETEGSSCPAHRSSLPRTSPQAQVEEDEAPDGDGSETV